VKNFLQFMPLPKKLAFIVLLFVLIVACLLVLACAQMEILSAVRAYVGGEGLWSKGQKDAVHHLARYAHSHDENYYSEYLAALAVPLGDRKARLELEKPKANLGVVRQGFVQGGNHPDDVASMARLFRRFRHVSYMARAITIWTVGDRYIARIERLGEALHDQIASGRPDSGRIAAILEEIDFSDQRLTPLEDGFSRSLARGARRARRLLLQITCLAAALLLTVGVSLSWMMLRHTKEWEARYLHLLDAANDAIVVTDLESGVILTANRKAEELLGIPVNRIVGMQQEELHPEGEQERYWQMLEERLRPGGAATSELHLRHADGHLIPVEISAAVTELAGETVVQSLLRDITERKRVEEERAELLARERAARAEAEAGVQRASVLAEAGTLLASSLDSETTLDNMARLAVRHLADWCGVHVLEADGSIRTLVLAHANPAKESAALELLRRYPMDPSQPHGPPNVIRTGQPELLPDVSDMPLGIAARDIEHLDLLRALGINSAMCVPLVAHGRTLGALTFNAAESRRRYGRADLALAEELARRAALAVDNARLYREAQDANRLKDDFLATLSHELRTPLSAILIWARLLRAGRLDEASQVRALDVIERNTALQARLIEDLLDVSRIITGKLSLEVGPVDMASTVEAASDALRAAADAKEILLEFVLDHSTGPVSGDRNRLQQVVWNLVANAIKFTPNGGRVVIRVEPEDGWARVSVRDTGIGIPAAFLPHIFERFRQADSTSTRSHGGLGLGLAIVRHLVELHGGTVEAQSPGEGQGATFIVKLPLLRERYATADAAWRGGSAPSAFDLPSLAGVDVLLVDDETDARESISAVLELCGARVRAVGSAAEAADAIDRRLPDVLVCDIGMPHEDGYALIRKVRARGPARGGALPAAALTAHARDEDRRRALEAGFHAHIAKPAEPAELASVVAALAGRAPGGAEPVSRPGRGSGRRRRLESENHA